MIVCYIRCIYVKLENLLSLDLVSSDMLDQTTPALLESPPRKLDSVLLQTNWPTCLPTYVYRTYRASNKERNGSQSADFFVFSDMNRFHGNHSCITSTRWLETKNNIVVSYIPVSAYVRT